MPFLANICTNPTPGLSILHFPPQNDDGTSDNSVDSLFPIADPLRIYSSLLPLPPAIGTLFDF